MEIPDSYQGREQTFLKHRVLEEYLTGWGHKLGSISRRGPVRLWYVDCFAGPWMQKDEERSDTSVAIGLKALNAAAETWRTKGFAVEVSAIFVEKDARAFDRLEKLVDERKGLVTAQTMRGSFGEHVEAIKSRLGSDAALLFIDPTGWKGAAMRYIAPLVAERFRDVVVNVMFNFINRFKDDPRKFLRDQMQEFFGLEAGDIPADLSEDELMRFYRQQLKDKCHVTVAADLAIPHPTQDRTWFRLVVGGKHPKVLELFRDIERMVVGREAGAVREAAKRQKREAKTDQLELGISAPSAVDQRYDELHRRGCEGAEADILARLQSAGVLSFGSVWPPLLEEHHIVHADAARIVMELHRKNQLVVRGLKPRQRVPKDDQILARP